MVSRKIRIGFCGVGSMGQMAHLKHYVVDDGCDVAAIAELRRETARAVARRYGIPAVYGDVDEMLAMEKLDAIVASQPFTRHGLLIPRLLKAGIPVMTEKPLAGSIAVGRRIVRAVERSGTFHMLGYHKRSDPATMYAKTEIDRLKRTGELGPLTYVRILMPAGDWIANGFEGLIRAADPAPALDRDPPPADMDEKTRQAYEAFVNYYIHQVNLLRHLLGEGYKAVFADRPGKLLVGESVSGVTCTIEMSPYVTRVDWQEEALVCFQHGWVRISLPAPLASYRPGRVQMYRDPPGGKKASPVLVEPTLPFIGAMRQQAANFIAAVKGRRAPLTTAREGLEDLLVARDYIRLFTNR